MQELNQIVDADGRTAPFHRPDFASQSGQKGLKFQDFNIFPNIFHVKEDADKEADAGNIAIALLN